MDGSTGLNNAMLAALKTAINAGFLLIFSGTIPASADAATSGATLLGTLTKDGDGTTGLTFGTASGSVLAKTPAEVWKCLSAVASGTASFCRFVASGDAGTGASTTASRLQLTVGLAGFEVNLNAIAITAGDPIECDSFFCKQQ